MLNEEEKLEALEAFYKKYHELKDYTKEDVNNLLYMLTKTRVICEFEPNIDENQKIKMRPIILTNKSGHKLIGIYTSNKHRKEENIDNVSTLSIEVLDMCDESILNTDLDGFVINPFTTPVSIPLPIIKMIIKIKNKRKH